MMTIQASSFTPEVLLSAPRRSAGIPNPTGELILYTVSTYSFESHSKTSQIRVQSIKDGSSHLVSEDSGAFEPIWIGEEDIAFLKTNDRGCTALMSQHVFTPTSPESTHMIQFFAGSLSNPKVKELSPGRLAFCCSASTTPEREMYWPSAEPKSYSSGQVYTSLFARHWDSWTTANQNSLWYGVLSKKGDTWSLESSSLTNLLAGTQLACPVPPFGGTGDFDISKTGIAFVAKDPKLNPARYTKTDLYYAAIPSFSEKPAHPQIVKTGKLRGYSLSPTFSKDGKKIAFTRMKSQQYESDKPRLLLIPDVEDLSNVQEFYETEDHEGGWNLRPDLIEWSNDDAELFVTADKKGRSVLWRLPSSPLHVKGLPTPVTSTEDGSVVEVKVLGSGKALLVSSRSLVESSCYCVIDTKSGDVHEVSTSLKHGKSVGLNKSQRIDIHFKGAAGYDIHALVTLPSTFDHSSADSERPRKKYPLAMLIHGGPQSAWSDDWSTRWNPAIFAEQGYVVVCPNPTGSTGYGQAHVDAIAGHWGGAPYEDLVKCFEYIKEELHFVDTERAVALGGSYGGYMINWIQGHDLGRKFKALVCHDGVFSTQSQWSTEELFFPEHDFGGTLWDNREGYEKWDPSRHLQNWATPQLVIHSELDYRLPMSEGVAMFNVLQAREVPSKLLIFPDENHWVLKPENSLVWHREVLGWINKYSGLADEAKLASETDKLTV